MKKKRKLYYQTNILSIDYMFDFRNHVFGVVYSIEFIVVNFSSSQSLTVTLKNLYTLF